MKTIEETIRVRWRIATLLTVAMVGIYFGFISLIAFDKELMATLLVPGLSLGIALGALVIVSSMVLTFLYVKWANGTYDPAIDRLRSQRPQQRGVAQ